jgi:hypothetical protein
MKTTEFVEANEHNLTVGDSKPKVLGVLPALAIIIIRTHSNVPQPCNSYYFDS